MKTTPPLPSALEHASNAGRDPNHRRRRRMGVVLVLVVAVIVAVLVLTLGLPRAMSPFISPTQQTTEEGANRAGDRPSAQDGAIPTDDGASPSNKTLPAVTKLKPNLRAAVQEAAKAARGDGISLRITSGWRDEKYQRWLYHREVARSGTTEAERLVAGSSSRHLTGDAVDVGPTDAAYWMQQHGADFGLCQMYNNEIWHYELVIKPGGTCPEPFLNAADRP